jgi:hypothetical protein
MVTTESAGKSTNTASFEQTMKKQLTCMPREQAKDMLGKFYG